MLSSTLFLKSWAIGLCYQSMYESCVHMQGAGIGWTKIISKTHAHGEGKSLVDTGGWRILRIASPICVRVLEPPEHFQPYKNDLILIGFIDFKEYDNTPTYQAASWWATWETHTKNIYHEMESHADLIKKVEYEPLSGSGVHMEKGIAIWMHPKNWFIYLSFSALTCAWRCSSG